MKALALPKLKIAIRKSLKYMARDIQLSVAGPSSPSQDAGLATAGSTRPGSASTWAPA